MYPLLHTAGPWNTMCIVLLWNTLHAYLNENQPERWIGHGGDEDCFLMKWLPWSPDLSLCDFFLWWYEKGLVYVPPLPSSIDELKQRITSVLDNITWDMLQHVWQELKYLLDMCHVTGRAQIECLWNQFQNKLIISNTKTVEFHWSRRSSFRGNCF